MTAYLGTGLRFGKALVGLLIAVGMTGCWYRTPVGGSPPPVPDEFGAITLAVAMPADERDAERLHVLLQQGDLLWEHTLPIMDGHVEDTLQGVYVGRWDVILSLWDRDGTLTHRGQTQVEVFPDEVSDLQVSLEPLPGQVHVVADLTDFRDNARVGRARLHYQPGDGSLDAIRTEGEDVIEWRRELPPGTYDARIALYGESFHSYRLIWEGPWFEFHVRPGRSVALTWRPATGEIRFHGAVHALPPAPTAVTARLEGEAVVVEWITTAPTAAETVIWWSSDPTERPRELVRLPALPVPGEGGIPESFRHRPADAGVAPGARLVYGVSTVDREGRQSLRTTAPPLRFRPEGGL